MNACAKGFESGSAPLREYALKLFRTSTSRQPAIVHSRVNLFLAAKGWHKNLFLLLLDCMTHYKPKQLNHFPVIFTQDTEC